jgi:hypothetical protein
MLRLVVTSSSTSTRTRVRPFRDESKLAAYGLRPRTFRMSSLARAPSVVLLTALVLSVGCKPEAAEPAPAVSANLSTKARFDLVLTTHALFAPADRVRMKREVQEQADGSQSFLFTLREEPGMKPAQHFYGLTVLVAPARAKPAFETSSVAGPGGSFVERKLHTQDGAFELVLRLGTRLPNGVNAPKLDLDEAARAIEARYAQQK